MKTKEDKIAEIVRDMCNQLEAEGASFYLYVMLQDKENKTNSKLVNIKMEISDLYVHLQGMKLRIEEDLLKNSRELIDNALTRVDISKL